MLLKTKDERCAIRINYLSTLFHFNSCGRLGFNAKLIQRRISKNESKELDYFYEIHFSTANIAKAIDNEMSKSYFLASR